MHSLRVTFKIIFFHETLHANIIYLLQIFSLSNISTRYEIEGMGSKRHKSRNSFSASFNGVRCQHCSFDFVKRNNIN